MKIKVKGLLTVKKAMGDRPFVEMDMESPTLRGVLNRLGDEYGKHFSSLIFDPETMEVRDLYQILVNSRHYKFLPGRLDTRLREGDVVAIIPPVAGG
ncbi:MAG: MoaD family protein [Pseudomonadota bacterium]